MDRSLDTSPAAADAPAAALGPAPCGEEERRLLRAEHSLRSARFAAAEHDAAAVLLHAALPRALRERAILTVAEARVVGMLDAGGGLAALQSMLVGDEPVSPATGARLHVVAALLFAMPHDLFDGRRAARHVAAARRRLVAAPDASDLVALAAVAELWALLLTAAPPRSTGLEKARGEWAASFGNLVAARSTALDHAITRSTRSLVVEVRSYALSLAGRRGAEASVLEALLVDARALDFAALEARVLARQAYRAAEEGALQKAAALVGDGELALIRAGAVGSWVGTSLAELRGSLVGGGDEPRRPWGLLPTRVRRVTEPTRPRDPGVAIARVARLRSTVLLVGGDAPTRLLVARAVHATSARPGSLVVVDCAARDAEELEMELFGHRLVGGASMRAAAGGEEAAARMGTLYLASVEDVPRVLQHRLLRFLDDDDDVRVVAGTARGLRERVAPGEFLADLAEKLHLVTLDVATRGTAV